MEKTKENKVEEVSETPNKEKKEKPKKSKLRKTLEIVFTSICGVLLAFLATIQIARWTNKDGYIFNYLFPQVISESMENHENPDDGYAVGEVIIVKKWDVSELKVGDDITFYYTFRGINNDQPVMCTHRIVEIVPNEDTSKDYKYTIVCKGINKDSPRWRDETQKIHEQDVLGKVVGKSAFVGFVYKAFSSVWTLLILIIAPSMYLVISAILDLFKKYPDDTLEIDANEKKLKIEKAGGDSRLNEMTPEQREKLKKEMLEEMLKKQKGK